MAKGNPTGEPAPKLTLGYLQNKSVLVVGGTSGIGHAVSEELAGHGARVTVVGRKDPKSKLLQFIQADLATVDHQTQFAQELPNPESIDLILFTQGILTPPVRTDNGEGIELDLAISYVGRRVILEQLLERGAKPQRVFIWGASGSEVSIKDWNAQGKYEVMTQHMNTVAANDALVLGYRTRRPDIPFFGLNPGIIKTGIRSNLYGNKWLGEMMEFVLGLVTPTTRQYASQIVNVVGAGSIPPSVVFFNAYGEPIRSSNYLSDPKNVEKIWADTDILIQQAKAKKQAKL